MTIGGSAVLMRFEGEGEYAPSVDSVRSRVQAENQRVQAERKGVVERELKLNLYSTTFPDLTLLDLPGAPGGLIYLSPEADAPLETRDVRRAL